MMRNYQEIEKAEQAFNRNHPLTIEQKFTLMDAMFEHAKKFGNFSAEQEAKRIQEKIFLAHILNGKIPAPY